ncbi:TPA: WzyE family oligosaccharide polymerase, partial [Enterobacter hormaechei]|nr:WzyE family oligosaccharide polymerase [Enterobacter hormaechei]
LKTQPATGETYPKSDLFNKAMPNRKNLFLCLCLSTLCGIIYYIVIGGSRNVLAAGVFSLVYLALLYKNINKKQLFLALAIGVMTLMLLELYRYVNNFSDALDFIFNGGVQVILFAFESFSPMHAVLNINDALTKNYFEIQYATTFLNEFSIIIPRFLWEGKPINVYNNGYFYTAEILGLDTNLTMSPTFLGSCLIMFGQTFYWIGGILCGLIIFIFDKIISSSKTRYMKLLLLSSIGYLFFWVQDGFEVYCYVLIKFGIIMMIMYAFNSFMSSLIIKR